MADYKIEHGGKTVSFTAAEGLSEEQQREVAAHATSGGAQQTLRFDAQGKQVEAPWDPHSEEKFDVGMGKILPSIGRAAKALPGSVMHTGQELWSLIQNYSQVYNAVRQMGFTGVAKVIGNDLVEHYGSLEKARRTFETDPARFLMDISAGLSGGGTLMARLGATAARIGEGVAAAGRAIDPVAMAARVGPAVVGEPAAQLLGRTTKQGAQTMRRARAAGYQGTQLPAALRPQVGSAVQHGLGLYGLSHLPGVEHVIAQHPILSGIGATVAGARSPRVGGSIMYGIGATERAGERAAPYVRGAAAIAPGRKENRKTYSVTSGGRTYKFEAPEGLTDEQQRQVVEHAAVR